MSRSSSALTLNKHIVTIISVQFIIIIKNKKKRISITITLKVHYIISLIHHSIIMVYLNLISLYDLLSSIMINQIIHHIMVFIILFLVIMILVLIPIIFYISTSNAPHIVYIYFLHPNTISLTLNSNSLIILFPSLLNV